MSEKATWACLKSAIDRRNNSAAARVFYQRFTDLLSAGIPDVMICLNGKTAFIELKQLDAFPKRMSTPVRVGYKKAQQTWANRYNASGGAVFLLVQVGRKYYLFNDIYVMELISYDKLTEMVFVQDALAIESTMAKILESILGEL
jgi:hypothetical protein